MKLILKDRSEIEVISSAASYLREGSTEKSSLIIRMDAGIMTPEEVMKKLTPDNLSEFSVEADGARRDYKNHELYKVIDNVTDHNSNLEIILYPKE